MVKSKEKWLEVLTPKLRNMLLSRALPSSKNSPASSLGHALLSICGWPDDAKFARLHAVIWELEEDGYTITRVTKTSVYCGKERVSW